MSTWFGIDVQVQIAFDNQPLTAIASCTWVDVSDKVRGISWSRGRSNELVAYGPGTATVTLDNRTRLFDASNTSGTYYGKLLPMKRLRIVIGSVVVFAGYVLGWPLSYPGTTDAEVDVQCVDALRLFEQTAMPNSAYGAEVLSDSPSCYWPMQSIDGAGILPAAAGGVDLDSTNTASYTVFDPVVAPGPVGASVAMQDGRAGAPLSIIAAPVTIEFWMYSTNLTAGTVQARVAITSTTYLAIFAAGSSIAYSDAVANRSVPYASPSGISTSYQTDGWAHIVVTATSTAVKTYMNGVLMGTLTPSVGTVTVSSFTTSYLPGVSAVAGVDTYISHLATYTTELSLARIQAHYRAGLYGYGHPYGEPTGTRIQRALTAAGWPAADVDIAAGSTPCGPWTPGGGTARSTIAAAEAAEQGLFFIGKGGKATFRDRQWIFAASGAHNLGDGVGELAYTQIVVEAAHIDYIRNLVSVNYPNGAITVKDDTSITAYATQADSVDGSALPYTAAYTARQLAASRLRVRKDPKIRVSSITFLPLTNASLPAIATAVELGDRSTIKRRPNGATDIITAVCTVQGIAQTMTVDGRWTCTLYLAPAPTSKTETPYLTMGDATYGKIGAAAANKVPY